MYAPRPRDGLRVARSSSSDALTNPPRLVRGRGSTPLGRTSPGGSRAAAADPWGGSPLRSLLSLCGALLVLLTFTAGIGARPAEGRVHAKSVERKVIRLVNRLRVRHG